MLIVVNSGIIPKYFDEKLRSILCPDYCSD